MDRKRISAAIQMFAAIQIQKVFRGARILYWKDMRLNVIAAYVLDRQYIERRESVKNARNRYRAYVLENRRDSASDPDEQEDEANDAIWNKKYDERKKRDYWVNEGTLEMTYEEPKDPNAHNKSVIGFRVKIYWLIQKAWYAGVVTFYNRRKKRHRIEYDDGDHEWLDLTAEHERVQVFLFIALFNYV